MAVSKKRTFDISSYLIIDMICITFIFEHFLYVGPFSYLLIFIIDILVLNMRKIIYIPGF